MSDGHGTHLRVMEKVFEVLRPRTGLEFGVGHNSTLWMLDRLESLDSIELDKEWVLKVQDRMTADQKSRWSVFPAISEVECFRMIGVIHPCDVILVDGAQYQERKKVAQLCLIFNMAPAIVLHDSERMEYAYDQIMVPKGWSCVRVEEEMPWTSVLTDSQPLIARLCESPHTLCESTDQLRRIRYPNIPSWEEQQRQKGSA